MKLVTPEQMNQIDSLCINKMGISGIVLMENAAIRVVDEIIKMLPNICDSRIIVFAGKGNNGGDAFAVARHLYNKGAKVKVYVTAKKSSITGDAAVNLGIIQKMGLEIIELIDSGQLVAVEINFERADLVVDGLLGTGIKGEVKELICDIIDAINLCDKPIVSIDIPSGIDGETGEVLGTCIEATKTVTFGFPKTGLVIHPGCEYTGELVVVDISIPIEVVDEIPIKSYLLDDEIVTEVIPERYSQSNKGDYGRVLIISGSTGMTGAGCLSASAALRTGSGLVYLGVPSLLTSIYDASLMESITIPLEDNGTGILKKSCINQILERLEKMDAVAIGPGLSVNDDIRKIIFSIIENSNTPLVLDADALNAIASDVSVLKRCKANIVITPHLGEMARLTGKDIDDIEDNRIKTAQYFAYDYGVVVVLKGSRTVIADKHGTVYINPTGNSGMATGGTGDVLTGIITSLIGQGVYTLDAAAVGVYLHGLVGDAVAAKKGEYGLTAGDLVSELPYVIKRLVE